jgi:hypothetical protein
VKVLSTILLIVALLFVVAGCTPLGQSGPFQGEIETWSSLLPLVVPFLIMLFQQTGLPKKTNGFIALGLCVVAVIADGIFFYGLGSITDWVTEMPTVVLIVKKMLVEIFVVYELMKKAGLADWVTEATTLKRFKL